MRRLKFVFIVSFIAISGCSNPTSSVKCNSQTAPTDCTAAKPTDGSLCEWNDSLGMCIENTKCEGQTTLARCEAAQPADGVLCAWQGSVTDGACRQQSAAQQTPNGKALDNNKSMVPNGKDGGKTGASLKSSGNQNENTSKKKANHKHADGNKNNDDGNPPAPTCVFSAVKAAAFCANQLALPAAAANAQGTCEARVNGAQACNYEAAVPNELCERTDFAAVWPNFRKNNGNPINNDQDFCTYLATDGVGVASDVNCDSIFLLESGDLDGDPESVCSRNGAAPGGNQCFFNGVFGPVPAWNDEDYCTDITNGANLVGGRTFQDACEASAFVIQRAPGAGGPMPTNINKAGLRFCTYQAPHPQLCTPAPGANVCAGKNQADCTGPLLANMCDWR
ncbi:MAG: hypothetical protein AAF310_03470 [Myxococcota bacterium]